MGKKYGFESRSDSPSFPLLHANLGAYVARDEYCVEDEEILEAIRNHTSGKENMSLLDKIIYLADCIEPLRGNDKDLIQIRREVEYDIDAALLHAMKYCIAHVLKKGKQLDERTVLACRYLENSV